MVYSTKESSTSTTRSKAFQSNYKQLDLTGPEPTLLFLNTNYTFTSTTELMQVRSSLIPLDSQFQKTLKPF